MHRQQLQWKNLFVVLVAVAPTATAAPHCAEINVYAPLHVQLLYLVPRLLPEARRAPLTAACPGGPSGEAPPEADAGQELDAGLWRGAAHTSMATWRKSAWQLWRNPTFSQLAQLPQYRVSGQWLRRLAAYMPGVLVTTVEESLVWDCCVLLANGRQ